MKKKWLFLIISIILLIILLFFLLTKINLPFSDNSNFFSVKDTAQVSKIIISDNLKNQVTLTKQKQGRWVVNEKYTIENKNMSSFMETISLIDVKSPVSRANKNKIIKSIKEDAILVEIFIKKYSIDLFGIKLFPIEKLENKYYVGGPTEDKTATFMMKYNTEEPYIIHIPGYRESLENKYSALEEKWRNHTILSIKLEDIKMLTLEFPETPEESYTIKKEGSYTYSLKPLNADTIFANYDTLKLLKSLSEMQHLQFEQMVTEKQLKIKDSILQSSPYHILTITDIKNITTQFKTYHKKAPAEQHEFIGTIQKYDLDRMYIAFNNQKDLAIIQFILFDNVLRPLSYYYVNINLKKENVNKN